MEKWCVNGCVRGISCWEYPLKVKSWYLHCVKFKISGRRYDNWNRFSYLGTRGKENRSIFKIMILAS